MKRITTFALLAILFATACRKIEVDGSPNNSSSSPTENTILEGRITSNRTLTANNIYKLRGLVYVTNGAILTIEPGTKIVGEAGRNGGLIITRSSKIIADGTPDRRRVLPDRLRSRFPRVVAMTTTDKRKQSLYFPAELLEEITTEADRLDRSISWLVQLSWKIARDRIAAMPSQTFYATNRGRD